MEAYLEIYSDHEAARKFLTQSKKIILEKCTDFLKMGKLQAHQHFLHRLSRRRVRDPRLKVFTTNYDLCFEAAAGELGGVFLDGFSFTTPRHYDPRYFGYDVVRRPRSGEDAGSYLEGVFLLYKLHGSVNWERDEKDSGRISVSQEGKARPERACLIYPASRKYQQSYDQPYIESVAQYLATVREPNTCMVVAGFGFNDAHLSEPLLAAVRSNPHLRLVIVDAFAKDNCTKREHRFWSAFAELSDKGSDIWFINASFGQFSELIPNLRALTPAENLFNAIQGASQSV